MSLDRAVWRNPERMSGALCFRGTRVTVSTLFDHLRANDLDAFYTDFPDVTPEAVQAVLDASAKALDAAYQEPAA